MIPEQTETPLTQAEIDRLVHGTQKPPVDVEDVYTLLAEVHAAQQVMVHQLNALVSMVNTVAAQIPDALEAIEASPLGGLLKRFMPRG
jgi:hypothetical protein